MDLRGIGIDADEISLHRSPAVEVDDRRNVRHSDAWKRAVHDRVDVELALVRELDRAEPAPRAALRAHATLAQEGCLTVLTSVALEIGLGAVGNFQKIDDR